MSNLKRPIVLGEGGLTWPKAERSSDRWASVMLCSVNGGFERLANAPVGQIARLVLIPLKADGGNDDRPAVGTEVELGVGRVFTDVVQTSEDWTPMPVVGVDPEDGRTEDWLNHTSLLNSHFQTVRLEARPV